MMIFVEVSGEHEVCWAWFGLVSDNFGPSCLWETIRKKYSVIERILRGKIVSFLYRILYRRSSYLQVGKVYVRKAFDCQG